MEAWRRPEINRTIAESQAMVILGRCGTEIESRLGSEAGIRLLQGWLVDDAIKYKQPIMINGV
jgi:hypothetical protein